MERTKNAVRYVFLDRISQCIRVYLFAVVILFVSTSVWSDAPVITVSGSDVQTPSPSDIQNWVKNNPSARSGRYFDPPKTIWPRHTFGSDVKLKTYGPYGESTSSTITAKKTVSPSGGMSNLSKAFGALMVLNIAKQNLDYHNQNQTGSRLSQAISDGDGWAAAQIATEILDWTRTTGGSSMPSEVINPLEQLIYNKAKNLIDNRIKPEDVVPSDGSSVFLKIKYITYYGNAPYTVQILHNYGKDNPKIYGKGHSHRWYNENGSLSSSLSNVFIDEIPLQVSPGISEISILVESVSKNSDILNHLLPSDINDIFPTESELTALMMKLLNDNNANHTELMNYLYGSGAMKNEDIKIQLEPNTMLSAPYTNAETGQAQQTKFTVNPDGSIGVSYVLRPDLAPNTSQAPTRKQIPTPTNPAPSQPSTQPAKPDSSPEKPDICAQNPNSLMCLDPGNTDYEDPIIPEKTVNLDFSPANIFGTDGVCPSSRRFSFMSTDYEMSYEPMCDFSRKVRPIFILTGILMAMMLAYGAVKEAGK